MSSEKLRDPPLGEQDLCTNCAACCDGTMFTHVEITKDEESALGAIFAIEPREADAIFHQPCAHSVGQRCQVYATRPQTQLSLQDAQGFPQE